jgi:hypothetical protein
VAKGNPHWDISILEIAEKLDKNTLRIVLCSFTD